ncbi:MAG: hypothetical protein ABFD24_03040 [Anaerolineaceae bacterium]
MKKKWIVPLMVLFFMTISMVMPQTKGVMAQTSPAIASDLADYPPGATVTLTGTNWAIGESVHIFVNDDIGNSWSLNSNPDPVADANGSFTYPFQLPGWFIANYTVTATGPTSGTATTTFTDMSVGTYDQCANDTGTGYTSGDTGCRWVNGNLQQSNSLYKEGDATVQRLWLDGFVPGSSHTVSFDYGTTKSGKHAYDFLTTWDWSENWITIADRCQDIPGCTTAGETSLPIPDDPTVPYDLGTRNFVMRGGTLNSATTPVVVSGSYAGDSDTRITVTFTVASSGDMCTTDNKGVTTCGIALWFGAHVAEQLNWGVGTGAGSIPGSPYHVSLALVDGASAGSRDNQMQAGALVLNGTIVIVKDAVPNDAQDFGFTLTNGTITNTFSLDDDSDPALPNMQSFSVPPGTWTATEGANPAGWNLTNIVCVDPTTNSTVNLGTRTASINLASNETVTCTFTNTKAGHIIVRKFTSPSGGLQSFEFDPSWSTSNFFLSDGQTHDSGALVPGTYSVSELTPPWTYQLQSATCDDGSPVSAISLQAGETVTCDFTNLRVYNQDLTVSKTATASFTRTYHWLINKDVDQTHVDIASGGTATFNYSVLVTPDGFVDSAWAVSGTITVSNPNSFDVTGVTITDAIDNGGSCTVTSGTNVTVPANSTAQRNYTCTFAAAPSPAAGTNTATAAWDATTFNTVNDSATGSAGVDFATVAPTEVNKVITVVDDKTDPGNWITLGTWNWADGAHTFTYSLIKSGVAGTCTSYPNTAKISETNQYSNASVEVCVGLDLTAAKTAAGTFNRTYNWEILKDVDANTINIASGGTATFNYTVNVNQTGFADSGWTLAGVITITNPNDWEDITLATLGDTVDNGGSCTVDPGPYVIPMSGHLDVNYTCSFASAPSSYSGTNTASITWDAAAAHTPTGAAQGTHGFTLTQLGSTNKTVNVTDTLGGSLGSVTGTDGTPYATATFTYSHGFSGVGGTCTDYDNTATITETGQHADKSVTVCVGLDLTVEKTAAGTFNRTYLWEISKGVDETTVNIANGGTATFNYTVDVNQTGFTDSGWTLSGTITIHNPNDWEDVTLSSLADAVDNGGTCTVAAGPYVIPKSGSLGVTYSCSFASAPSSLTGTNTATAGWNKATYFTPNNSAQGSHGFTLAQLGATNKTINVTDTLGGALGTVTANDGTPYATAQFTYSHDFSGVGGTCTDYDNTATITETGQNDSKTVTVCVGLDLTVAKTATGTFHRSYLWEINKNVDQTTINIASGGLATFNYSVTVNQTGFTDSAWVLEGTITLGNPNDWEAITLTDLTDAVDNGGTCSVVPGPYNVPASGTLDVSYSCSYASAPSSYTGTNTATASWDAAAAHTPSGSANGSHGFTMTISGTTNKTVNVTDTLGGALGSVTATDGTPYASQTFNYSHDFAGIGGTCTNYDNTATITETAQSDSKTVTVCVGLDLTVTKTATPTFTRTYTWQIAKGVERNLIAQVAGQATFDYTVTVTQLGFVDSDWMITGTITVSNPNDWEAITADITDSVNIGGDADCAVTNGAGVSIPASGSVTRNYTCTFTSKPLYTGTNTGTATWVAATYHTPNGSANGTAPISFSSPTEVNKTVTITDNFEGNLVTLGTATAVDTTPYTVVTFTYSHTVPIPEVNCVSYDNTATIVETNQTASQTITVCQPSILTDTEYCPLVNNQFRLGFTNMRRSSQYTLNATNPGQFYYNAFYFGTPGEPFTMTISIPYPFMTQEGAANPIQVHDGTGVTAAGCFMPTPSLSGFTITTQALTPTSKAGKQIITADDYTLKAMGQATTVTISGNVPATGLVYVTIHLDYGLKGTNGWSQLLTWTHDPVSNTDIYDLRNAGLAITIHGYEVYNFSQTTNAILSTTAPSSVNDPKKFTR